MHLSNLVKAIKRYFEQTAQPIFNSLGSNYSLRFRISFDTIEMIILKKIYHIFIYYVFSIFISFRL